MSNWWEEYQRKMTTPDKVASLVESGNTVAFTSGREAHALGLALAARKDELSGVKVYVRTPGYDFGWYDRGWDDSFEVTLGFPTEVCQEMLDERRADFNVASFIPYERDLWAEGVDLLLTEVSPPDDKGFCSFGASLWNKKEQIGKAKIVAAEVNKNLIRTFGDNFIHVSEIDYFVEHLGAGGAISQGTLAGRYQKEPEPYLRDIVGYVSSLIEDGDVLQIGVGRTTEPLLNLGLLDGKQDIGWHSEATPPRLIRLVREGVVNGKYKTIDQGKVVVTSIGGSPKEDMDWVNMNSLFWLKDVYYIESPLTLVRLDNLVCINNALAVDLSGQIASETMGTKVYSAAGGQTAFAVGAYLSKGGRFVIVMPATAKGGTVSRILPAFPVGTQVTVPKSLADYVVTEYGIAKLRGKTLRQRAEELISAAAPEFRTELRKEARRLLWP